MLPDMMEKGMEKEFWSLWDKWRKKSGVNLDEDLGRQSKVANAAKDEL